MPLKYESDYREVIRDACRTFIERHRIEKGCTFADGTAQSLADKIPLKLLMSSSKLKAIDWLEENYKKYETSCARRMNGPPA